MRFLSLWVLPALPDAGRAPSSWQPGHAGSLGGGCRKRVQDGEKEKHLDMKGLAVTSWPGLVLCRVGTVQAPVCLLLPRVASLCFGFALFWICSWFLLRQESPSDGGFMHVTKSDTWPRQEAPS